MTSPDKRVPRLSDFPPDEREAIVAAIAAKRAARAARLDPDGTMATNLADRLARAVAVGRAELEAKS